MAIRPTTPPTTPPTIAPVLVPPPLLAPPVVTDPTPDEVTTVPSALVTVVYTKLVETGRPALLRLLAELAIALL